VRRRRGGLEGRNSGAVQAWETCKGCAWEGVAKDWLKEWPVLLCLYFSLKPAPYLPSTVDDRGTLLGVSIG